MSKLKELTQEERTEREVALTKEWLTPREVALVTGAHRMSIHRLLQQDADLMDSGQSPVNFPIVIRVGTGKQRRWEIALSCALAYKPVRTGRPVNKAAIDERIAELQAKRQRAK